MLARVAAISVLVLSVSPANAQRSRTPEPEPDPWPVQTERELRRLGLDAPLAARLEARFDALPQAADEQRVEVAEQLAEVYIRLLSQDAPPIPKDELRSKAQRLIIAVPGEATVGLRLTLAVARYASIETDAERERFNRLAPERAREVADQLRALRGEFASTARDLDTRVERLERLRRGRARSGREFDPGPLDEATRYRSLSSYYAAWCGYYLSRLDDEPELASMAIEDFGRLLDSPDETPTLDRLPIVLLRYDPVARSALGVAMCYAVLDNTDLALSWIRTLREASSFPDHLESELDTRTAQILLETQRWTELRDFLERLDPKSNLSVAEWRLVVDTALYALESRTLSGNRATAAESLSGAALRYLLTSDNLPVVLDIARAHPNLPLDGTGFAIKYVKGVEAFQTAQRAHEQRGEELSEPTAHPQVATLYRGAARQLTAALQAADAPGFESEQAACAHLAGQAQFAAGDLEEAAETLERAYALATSPADAEGPLWLAIAVLDRLDAEGDASAGRKRNELAQTYLERYDNTERAGLLLRLVGQDIVDPDRAIEILGEIPPGATYADAAAQYRASLTYTEWKNAPPADRARLARIYLPLASALIDRDAESLRSPDPDDDGPGRTARRVLLTARRALDVALSSDPPELDSAEATLRKVESLERDRLIDPSADAPEFGFRRVQIALASDRLGDADDQLELLRILTGPFADAAERLVYTDALDRLDLRPGDPGALARVVASGRRVLSQLERPGAAGAASRAGVMNSIADAAYALWTRERDESMRDLALRLDTEAFNADIAAGPAVLRLAALAEQTLDLDLASRAWLRLMATSRPPDPQWFTARANSIRLLAEIDPDRAIAAIRQHRVLYPTLGPERDAEMILEAARALEATTDHTCDPPRPAPDASGSNTQNTPGGDG
ncbi:MAG: hypothetical protein ACF8Q5_06510 [Phycisphaerales bacterium JB040]